MQALGARPLVVAFDGWNDAGEAASSALEALRASGGYSPAFAVDPELYFDYQYTRPTVGTGADGERTLTWPGATLWRPEDETAPWLLTGVEPARAWQGFASEFVDRMLAEDITSIVMLGSLLADVPHTRALPVSASSDDAGLRTAFDLERSQYEGPVGILSVIADAAGTAGIPSVSVWVSVPHYVASHTPSPKAALALLRRLHDFTAHDVPLTSLESDAARWEASIDAAAAEDEDLAEYVRQLEQTRDTWDSPEASGDAIAREFERFLRKDGDGPRRQ